MLQAILRSRPWWITIVFFAWLWIGIPLIKQHSGISHAESNLILSISILLFGALLWLQPGYKWIRTGLISRLIAGWLIAACLYSLWPWMNLFSSSTEIHQKRRLITLGLLLLFGWLTIGGGLFRHRLRTWFGWFCIIGLIWGTLKGIETAGELTNRKLFRGTVKNPWLLTIFGINDSITEKHWFWTPYITLTIAAFPTVCLGAALRLWTTAIYSKNFYSAQRWGALIIGASLIPLQFDALQPLERERLTDEAWQQLPQGVPSKWLPLGWLPPTAIGHPFHYYFRYQPVVNNDQKIGQFVAYGQVFRVMERDSSEALGKWHLAAGRDVLNTDALEKPLLSVAALITAAQQDKRPHSALIVGNPEPIIAKEWQRIGIQKIDVSTDPLDQIRLDWLFNPHWAGIQVESLLSLSNAQQKKYDLVLATAAAPWRTGESPLRPGWLKKISSCVKEGGTAALYIPLNFLPATLAPMLLSEFQKAFRNLGECRTWFIPRQIQVPGILLTSGPRPNSETLNATIQIGLNAQSIKAKTWEEIEELEIPFNSKEASQINVHEQEEWNRLHQRIVSGIPKEVLAAESLAAFAQTPLTKAMTIFLRGQEWTLPDSQFATELEKLDLTRESVQAFLNLAKENPNSIIVKELWISLAKLLIEKREIEWAEECFTVLLDELQWRNPVLLWAAGKTALEMLEPELALSFAQEALALQPEMKDALLLEKNALEELGTDK